MTAGRDATSEGALVSVRVVGFRRHVPAPRPTIPIWLAAVRPGMATLAGELADGFLDHPVTSPLWMDEVLEPALRRGAEKADRERPAIAGALTCAVDEDRTRALGAAALTVGFYATVRTYEELFAGHGFGARLPDIRTAFLSGEPERLIDAVGEEMTLTFAAVGTADQVRKRARDAYGGRVDRLWATPPHHLQGPDDLSHWQAGIRRAFGA